MTISNDSIKSLLSNNDGAVGRAMVVLLSRQTEGEQCNGTTVECNGRGFSAFTASSGTYYAKWVLGLSPYASQQAVSAAITIFLSSNGTGRALTGKHLQRARKIAVHHHKQLFSAAVARSTALQELSYIATDDRFAPDTMRSPVTLRSAEMTWLM